MKAENAKIKCKNKNKFSFKFQVCTISLSNRVCWLILINLPDGYRESFIRNGAIYCLLFTDYSLCATIKTKQ